MVGKIKDSNCFLFLVILLLHFYWNESICRKLSERKKNRSATRPKNYFRKNKALGQQKQNNKFMGDTKKTTEMK